MSDGDNTERTNDSGDSDGSDVMGDVLAKMVAEHGYGGNDVRQDYDGPSFAFEMFVSSSQDVDGLEMLQDCAELATLNSQPAVENGSCQETSAVPVLPRNIQHGISYCMCKNCQLQRKLLFAENSKSLIMVSLWDYVRNYIRSVFDIAIDAYCTPNESHQISFSHMAKVCKCVYQLSKKDPTTLLVKLVGQAQEFVVEVKVRLMILLHDKNTDHLAEDFLAGLLDCYDVIISTALQVSKMIEFLKTMGFCNLNIKWEDFNKKLYQLYVYTDPLVRNNLPTFISQLRKLLPKKGSEYQALVHRYLEFDHEMTQIDNLNYEAGQLLEKHYDYLSVKSYVNKMFDEGYNLYKRRCALKRTCKVALMHESEEIKNRFTPKYSMERILDGWNKPPDQRIPLIVEKIISYDKRPCVEPGIGPPYWNDIEFLFGYESALIFSEFCSCEAPKGQNGQVCMARAFVESVSIESVNSQVATDNNHCSSDNEVITNGIDDSNLTPEQTPLTDWKQNCSSSTNGTLIEEKCCDEETTETPTKEMGFPANKELLDPCPCVYYHAKEIMKRKKPVLTENPPCPCLFDSTRKCDAYSCLKTSKPMAVATLENSSIVVQHLLKYLETQEAPQKQSSPKVTQIKTPPLPPPPPPPPVAIPETPAPQTRHSTTQTTNLNQKNNTPQDSPNAHSHANLVDTNKVQNATHRTHGHTSVPCHKQHTVEHIKRLPSIDLSGGDGDCSDSGSSHEDSCSTSSSTPRDSSRHCDCCYCEVFGHGVPSVAPVSRNYNEMRERLRQLLTRKREKKCKTEKCSPPKSPTAQLLTQPQSTEPKLVSATQVDSRLSSAQALADVDDLLNFIEGKKIIKKDDKKAEKKARQKQRKLEEKQKKDREEEERQKLIELRKKTPEVTITVVDPQKPASQRLGHNRNLPEVSILPASAPVVLTPIPHPKQQQSLKENVPTKKSKNKNSQAPTAPQKATSNQSKKSKNSVDRVEGVPHSKAGIKQSQSKQPPVKEVEPVPATPSLLDKFKTLDPNDPSLTKKERKKLRRELRKAEENAKEKQLRQKPIEMEKQTQIVTIRRVIEANSAEPTVTITLKGQTPAEDKVLYTLVNGQTKEPDTQLHGKKKKKKKGGKIEEITQVPVPIPVQTSCATCSAKQQELQRQQQQRQAENLKEGNKNQKSNTKDNSGNQKGSNVHEEVNQQQQTKSSKKKKNKNSDNKENVVQQNVINGKGKNQQQSQQQQGKKQKNQNGQVKQDDVKVQEGKKKNNSQHQPQQHEQQQNQQKNQQQKNNQNQSGKKNKNGQEGQKSNHQEAQKNQGKPQVKQNKVTVIPQVQEREEKQVHNIPLSSQFKEFSGAKIDIENLKLPPGITITKVDVPMKPIPIKSTPMPKPKSATKQTAIIATSMGGTATGYGSSQNGSNVIVVDTGKLKQDLMPRPEDKDLSRDTLNQTTTSGKKKKKKKKNNQSVAPPAGQDCVDYDQPARILHNPATNMVTIRNPAFGPPKVDSAAHQLQQQQQQQQQAAIIKVSENGMVTIRSPALQQAINAGLTPPPKPDFIVKGDLPKVSVAPSKLTPRNGLVDCLQSRLSSAECPGLSDLANIQISKVANGHPIPENGINLRGTSVTLTKVKSEEPEAAASAKPKKKKKRAGAGASPRGDDWNLVESVFTPKDIDLEDGEMDDAERELEAFKRFCLQSVPPPRKEKVNLNIKDIVLKKKAAAVIAAN